jgi:hypothetical protein
VCFVDGCGDPAKDIRVEVTPATSTASFARDLALDEVRARQDLRVPGAAILQGFVRVRDNIFSPPQRDEPPSTEVSIRGQGESKIIPGVQRAFESSFAPPSPGSGAGALGQDGSYMLPVSAGEYSLTATVNPEPTSPPLYTQQRGKVLQPGTNARIDFVLEALAPVYSVDGQLVLPPSTQADMELQALSDAIKLLPLSQRIRVGPTGTFTLHISPTVLLPQNRSFIVQARPRDQTTTVPQKIFGPVTVMDRPIPLKLDFGDFGPVVTVVGEIHESSGNPIANATVYLEGPVANGGTFRSQSVLTVETGGFVITSLSSAPTATLWAIPPSQSTAGILRTNVRITGNSPHLDIGPLSCPDKVVVVGKIYKADGSNAPDVRVIATPIKPWQDKPLPVNGGQTFTGPNSFFTLNLDPGIYRLDFVPGDQLARASRFATVPDPITAGFTAVQLPDFSLSNGRRLSGNVFATDPEDNQVKISPNASLRFFRLAVLPDEKQSQSSVLLGQTVADGRGSYSVILPTR